MSGRGARLGVLALLISSHAAGQGEPIDSSRYRVDLTQGPVLAGSRVIGLAGAYVAIAEGVDGTPVNPAAPAVRVPWSDSHFDWDLGFGVTFPSAIENSDFFNRGQTTDLPRNGNQDILFLNAAGTAQFGTWGLGASVDLQEYDLIGSGTAAATGREIEARFAVLHLALAHAVADGQVLAGLGVRTTTLQVVETQVGELFATTGAAPEAGLLIRPNWEPFRLGIAWHGPIVTEAEPDSRVPLDADGNRVLDVSGTPFYLPNQVALPWDVNLGFALQLGPRPFNPRWVDPSERIEGTRLLLEERARTRERRRAAELERARRSNRDVEALERALDAELETEAALDALHWERAKRDIDRKLARRYEELSRSYVLISGSLLVTGKVDNGVGVESFLSQRVDRSGEEITYSPRLSLETEAVAHRVQVRAGAYGEPTRFSNNVARHRLHGTLGFTLKLFPWDVFGIFDAGSQWRLTAAVDLAERYFGWGGSIGLWH